MSMQEEELKKLLAIKKKEEENKVLSDEEQRQKAALGIKHADFLKMTSQEMEKTLTADPSKKSVDVGVKSPTIEQIIQDYKKRYPNAAEPVTKEGKTELFFPSQKEAAEFLMDQASKNRRFIVTDQSGKVIAYSNGDGQLYNGNGSQYKSGEFQASNKSLGEFEMPKVVQGVENPNPSKSTINPAQPPDEDANNPEEPSDPSNPETDEEAEEEEPQPRSPRM